jgi:alginate O-acetyltransferase complex protein AlgJ
MRFLPPKMDFSREEAAEREIGRTSVRPFVRWFLAAAFLLTIAAVPAVQYVHEAVRTRQLKPRALDFLSAFPAAGQEFARADGIAGGVAAASASLRRDFKAFEKSLEDESLLVRHALPPVQEFAARFLGLGNEKVYLGRDGWLFYRPDVDYVAGPGFLDPAVLRARGKGSGIHPDPLPALVRFREDLAARGIRLLVVPVPVKPVIEPEHLSARRHANGNPPQNPSYPRFLADLRRNGIDALDITPVLAADKAADGIPCFLKTDTHWSPRTVERVAELIAEGTRIVPGAPGSAFRRGPSKKVTNAGDLAVMLRLSPQSTLFPRETVEIRPVTEAGGAPWRADPAAEILVLGDSFTNVYSGEDLGWGTGSGLAEQLSFALQRPVDRIAVNAGGAYTARQTLARSPGRLAGKRLVIYEFAMRDLASGDWKVTPLAEPKAEEAPAASTVTGVIREISRAPRPGTVPYKDLLICLHLDSIGNFPFQEILVFLPGMKNNVLTAATSLAPGRRVTLRVVPWNTVEEKTGAINRIELGGPAADIGEVYWAGDLPSVPP